MSPWQIWVDTGGTFTDCLATNPQGVLTRLKVLSNGSLRGRVIAHLATHTIAAELNWPFPIQLDGPFYHGFRLRFTNTTNRSFTIQSVDTGRGLIHVDQTLPKNLTGATFEIDTDEEVPVFATRLLTGTPLASSFPAVDMKLGSTRGTNAILERKGARTALLITKGFADLLVIGNQQRPNLFALHVQKEAPLYDEVIEIEERIGPSGGIETSWLDHDVAHIVRRLKKKKIQSVAVALLNSFRNPIHESVLSTQLRREGIEFISVSHLLSKQIRFLPRTETTVVNAYLAPIIHNYVNNIVSGLKGGQLKIMTSAGGLASASNFFPKDSLLSGPAGGIVGAFTSAGKSGHSKIITFDMGGTSTDVSLLNGRPDYRYESRVGNLKILSPSLAIETIAAGGGSICSFDGYRLTVGPESAGASPGPACYGAGGPLTITDVNLLLGRIDPLNFSIPLSKDHAEAAFDKLLQQMNRRGKKPPSRIQVLLALVQIANEKMAGAIQKVSTQSGHNPADYVLLSFGGAGGQHACALASMLNITRVLIPYDAGLLSAYGIGHARIERFAERLLLDSLSGATSHLRKICDELYQEGKKQLIAEGIPEKDIEVGDQLIFVRFKGQENQLEIDLKETGISFEKIRDAFRERYERTFSHWLELTLEAESVRVIARTKGNESSVGNSRKAAYQPKALRHSFVIGSRGKETCSIFSWEELHPGATIQGPAIVASSNSTTLVESGWVFSLDEYNNALLENRMASVVVKKHSSEAELELFTNRFTNVALEMGAMLQRTSFSINVKERLDFSCAVLDEDGYLVVNAPHIPVHLGSLGVCVREVVQKIDMREGDVIITNHPAFGGSHLPDVTLIKPVFVNGKRIAFVANRAHHAEIGGRKPGSMPADARTLEEEGVIIEPMYLVRNDEAHWHEVERVFTTATWPTRAWAENRADLNGALASVNFGEQAIVRLCERYSPALVRMQMKKIREHAAELIRAKLRDLKFKRASATQYLDDGSPLRVSLALSNGKLVVDFKGSSAVHPGNLNATRAIVQSVVLYVIRILVGKEIPMNEGLMDRVTLKIPTGLLNPNFDVATPPAVVGGNTEVSQRLTDTLLLALKLAACSQGTMNNFLFGNRSFGYYETICGGTGAGPGFHGTSAVHQHMTNTRISDPEILEWRFPIRLIRFAIRRGSGGKGKWNGGDGIVREFLFTDELELNILSQHRVEEPYGMKGGGTGKCGRQYIVRANGKREFLKGMDSARVHAGDRLIIETPGGGAWGPTAGALGYAKRR